MCEIGVTFVPKDSISYNYKVVVLLFIYLFIYVQIYLGQQWWVLYENK